MAFGFNTPFAEQLAFFRQKLNLPSEHWDDIERSAHDRGFIVAGAAKADLLDDLRRAVDKAIAEGKGIAEFRKDFKAAVKAHNWHGWTGEGTKAGEAWRTRVIYETNMATSYAAGRYRQLTDPGFLTLRPFWRYKHADGVLNPRLQHVAWNGLTLPHDHPFWQSHFPPNGWGCHCRVTPVDAREYEKSQAEGKAEPPEGWDERDAKGNLPGVAKGFDYAPGANAARSLKSLVDEKLIKLDAPIGAAMYEALRPALAAEAAKSYTEWARAVLGDPVKRGRTEVVGALDRATLDWLALNRGIRPASAEIAVRDDLLVGKKAARHKAGGDALSDDDWLRLPSVITDPERILFDARTGKLLFVGAHDGQSTKLSIEFDYAIKKAAGVKNLIVSAYKVRSADVDGAIRGGLLEVVK
jgi:hypothetical protein